LAERHAGMIHNAVLRQTRNSHMRTKGVAVLFALVLFIFSTAGFARAAQTFPNHVPVVITNLNLRPVGRLPAATRLNLAIGLPWRNREALTNLLRNLYDPASRDFHHFLSPQQFAERFGPTTNDYEAVIAFAQAQGLTVTRRHPNRVLVDVSGPVPAVERAFHVHMLVYHHPTEARDFYAPDTDPTFDTAVSVLDINGLDNYELPTSYVHIETNLLQGSGSPTPFAGSGNNGLYRGYDFRDAYLPDVTLTGTGQSVGLLEFDGYYSNDIAIYEQRSGLPPVSLQNVLLDSVSGNPGSQNLEVALDIEMAIAMAPGLSNVIVYEGTSSADILSQMATDDLANQLSSSWKPFDASALTDQDLQELMAQGQSMFQASGDSDAQPALAVSQPGDPYYTLVGGTSLRTTGPFGSWVGESVWNNGNGGGSGGGISAVYSIPSWQQAVDMSVNQGSTTMRNSPDVALTASNVTAIAHNGVGFGVDGTSCAAPLWAGFMALVNEQATNKGMPPVGFLNPAIYAIGLGPDYASCFHDITSGDNTSSSSPDEFYAEPGYDLCTGWGTCVLAP